MDQERVPFRIMLSVLVLWILAQIVVVIYFWGEPQGSDQGAYIDIARRCFAHNEWYPMQQDIYSSYIWAPGFINFLILQLKAWGTLNLNMILNLLMNLLIVGEIFYLGERFFNRSTAIWAVILWCLLYSNLMIVAPAGTEIPFLWLSLTAFCFCLSPRIYLLIVAGVLFALANWIRPLVIIFVLTTLAFMVIKKFKPVNFLALLLPLFLTVFVIGKATEQKTGYFVFQSSTSGANLIMTANDKAYGGVAVSVLTDSTSIAYIPDAGSFTFAQKDSIWKARAVAWIKEHPVKFAKLYLLKFGGLYVEDSWADRPLLGGGSFVSSYVVDGKVTQAAFVGQMTIRVLKSIGYYLVLLLFFYALIVHRKSLLSEKGILLMILITGTLLTNIFSVSPRYHYPFVFVLVLFAAYGIDGILKERSPVWK